MAASLKTTGREDSRYPGDLRTVTSDLWASSWSRCGTFAGGGMPVSRGIQRDVLRQSSRRVSWAALLQGGAVPVKARSRAVHLWRVS